MRFPIIWFNMGFKLVGMFFIHSGYPSLYLSSSMSTSSYYYYSDILLILILNFNYSSCFIFKILFLIKYKFFNLWNFKKLYLKIKQNEYKLIKKINNENNSFNQKSDLVKHFLSFFIELFMHRLHSKAVIFMQAEAILFTNTTSLSN